MYKATIPAKCGFVKSKTLGFDVAHEFKMTFGIRFYESKWQREGEIDI